jgi:hypothetical protein
MMSSQMQGPFLNERLLRFALTTNGFQLGTIVGLRRAMKLPEAIQQTAKAAKRGKSRIGAGGGSISRGRT